MPKKLTKIELGGVSFSTGHYGKLEGIDLKTTFIVSISNGNLRKGLEKNYGLIEGDRYFCFLNMVLGYKLGPSWEIYSTYRDSLKLQRIREGIVWPEERREIEKNYHRSFVDEILGKIDLKKLILEISKEALKQGKSSVVFLCHEKPHEFCHRFILAKYLNMFILQQEVQEIFVGRRHDFHKGRVRRIKKY